jgi:hypothetical protein
MPLVSRVLIVLALSLPAFASDLTVGWISRQPELLYVWDSSNPQVQGWPSPGQTVTWRAHVRSWFDRDESVAYAWKLDGHTIATGTAKLAPGGHTSIDLQRPWSFERERLSIVIDTANAVAEQSEKNNSLEVFTDALALGLWVEQSFYDRMRERELANGSGSTSWENWAQSLVELSNDMAAMAIYPETPSGVIDRWRLQKVVIVPDGALPLVPPVKAQRGNEPRPSLTQPDSSDRTVDLQWGFPADRAEAYASADLITSAAVLHELGHARYLTDVYAFDVVNAAGHRIAVPGVPRTGYVYYTPEQGLMNRNHTFIDRYSAIALNRIAGQRAKLGNYNDPDNVGEFLNDLPAENRLTIRDAGGALVANATVEIYQSTLNEHDSWYSANYDAEPDLRRHTDAKGQVLVGRNPFSSYGPVVNYWKGSNVVAIVRVEKDGVARIGYLESRLFNLAYWRGETMFAEHELVVGRAKPCGFAGPQLVSPAWDASVESPRSRVSWRPVHDAVSYNVFAASPTTAPRLLGSTTFTDLEVVLSGRSYWWVEAVFANSCPPLRSDSRRVNAPLRTKRRAVGR